MGRPTCDQSGGQTSEEGQGKKFFQAPPPSLPCRTKRELLLSWGDQLFCWGSQLLHAGIRKRLYAVFFHHTSNLNKKNREVCAPNPKKSLSSYLRRNETCLCSARSHCRANQPTFFCFLCFRENVSNVPHYIHAPGSRERESRGNTCQST